MLCQICLESKKKLMSISLRDQEISYEDMITFVADVKIENNANYNICLYCRRKLREFYDFKILIKNSCITTQSACKRKFIFGNIKDIRSDFFVNFLNKKSISLKNMTVSLPNLYMQDELRYADTTIKVINDQTTIKEEPENYDDTIKTKLLNDDDFDNSYPDLESMPNTIEDTKENISRVKSTKKFKSKVSTGKILIRPIFMKDYRVLSTYIKKTTIKNNNNKKTRIKRMDICPHCGKVTKNIKSHMWIHTGERKFKCSKCHKKFYNESQLRSHYKEHLRTTMYKCDHCIAEFNKKGSLTKHLLKHQEFREYVCNICNKAFKWRSGLQRHKLTHYPSAKSVPCELCSMTFISKYGLRHHMRVHTGERPYKCELCSQPYSYKHDFNRHCFKKHGIFLKRRPIKVMNEEVLAKERELLQELLSRIKAAHSGGEFVNPFKGPQAAQAFELALKQLQCSGQLPPEYL